MKKTSLIILLVLVLLLSCITVVNAAEGHEAVLSLTTSNTNVKVGDEISVNLVIDSVTGFSGFETIAAEKVFDSNIFEYLGSVGQNGWEVKGDGSNLVIHSETTTKSGVICVLKFKALKPVENSAIQLSKVDASGDDGDVYYDDGNVNSPSVTFKITSVDTNTDTNTTTNTDTNTNTNTNTNSGTNTSNGTNITGGTNKINNDKTTATGNQIPQAGESYFAITLVIVGVVLAIGLYTKYKVFDNKMK